LLVLQDNLPAESSAMLYEELAGGTSEIRPLVERVLAAAPEVFDATRFVWWNWPDEQVTQAAVSDEKQRREHAALMRSFEAPFERKPLELGMNFQELLSKPGLTQEQRDSVWDQRWRMEYEKMQQLEKDGDAEKLFGRPSSGLLKTRLEQIEGNHDRSIIQRLQQVRHACIDDAITFSVPVQIERTGVKSIPIPDSIQIVNRQATGSSLYWIAICQMDRSKPGTAISSFANYRRQYPDGPWFYPSLINQAFAELAQGRPEAALKTLTEADHEANPERAQVAMLVKRMEESREVLDKPAEEPVDAPEATTNEADPVVTEE